MIEGFRAATFTTETFEPVISRHRTFLGKPKSEFVEGLQEGIRACFALASGGSGSIRTAYYTNTLVCFLGCVCRLYATYLHDDIASALVYTVCNSFI